MVFNSLPGMSENATTGFTFEELVSWCQSRGRTPGPVVLCPAVKPLWLIYAAKVKTQIAAIPYAMRGRMMKTDKAAQQLAYASYHHVYFEMNYEGTIEAWFRLIGFFPDN